MQEPLVENLNMSQLRDRIYNLKERGKSFNQAFNELSNGLMYGTISIWKEKGKPEVKTLSQLREQIRGVYYPVIPVHVEGGRPQLVQVF